MNRARYLGYRLVWAAIASVVVTVVLFVIALHAGDLTGNPQAQAALPDTPEESELWNPDDPVIVQYLDWVYSLVTFEWGVSERFGEPVASLFADRLTHTAAYLLPAIVLGTAIATVFGYLSAARRGTKSARAIRTTTYIVLALPNFVIAAAFARYLEQGGRSESYDIQAGVFAEWNLIWLATAAVILGTHVAAIQIRHVRAQSTERFQSELAKLLRSKGVGRLRTARHILRASAVPLTALFVAEIIGLLLVSVFVIEAVLAIPGVGYVTWQAVGINDTPVVLAATFLVAATVITASIFEDILTVLLDPRLDEE